MIVDVHTHLPKYKQSVKIEEPKYYTARPNRSINMDALCWEDHFQAMKSVDKAIVFRITEGKEDVNDLVAEYVSLHLQKSISVPKLPSL